MRLTSTLAAVGMAAGLVAAPGQAVAAGPDRETASAHVHEVWGSCGPGDRLIADYVITETVTQFSSDRWTLHLVLDGTIARTGTGVVGTFLTRQQDFGDVDGSERDLGLLGRLVVPGGRGVMFAGQVWVDVNGDLTATPNAKLEVQIDEEAVVDLFCDALDH